MVEWLDTLGYGAEGSGFESGMGKPAAGKLSLFVKQEVNGCCLEPGKDKAALYIVLLIQC